MKKKLLTASILIGLGGLLIMAGYSFGGKPSVLGGEDFDEWDVPSVVEDVPLTVLASSGIKAMNCQTDVGTLRVLAHDKPDFAYSIHNTAKRVKTAVYCKDDTLYIEMVGAHRKHFWSFGLWWNDFKWAKRSAITVYVPRQFNFETVTVASGAARIAVGDFKVSRKFVLHGGVGEVTVQNVTAAGAQIETGVGKNAFTDCAFTDMYMATGIGENVFTGVLYGHTVVRTGIGEISFNIAGKREDYQFTLNAGLGDIYIDGRRVSGGFEPQALSDENSGTGAHTVKIESGIGKVRINFTGAKDAGSHAV